MVIVDPKITLRTQRLFIRPLAMEDAEDLHHMLSHPEVLKHTPLVPFENLEKTKAWIQGCHDRENCWNFCIEMLPPTVEDGTEIPRVIGLIGAVRAPEIGYMLNTNYWGKGLATEALRAFLPAFFDHFSGGKQGRFEYADAFTDPDLLASQNVLKKAGFHLHERRVKDFNNPRLGLRDTLVFRKYRPDSNTEMDTVSS